MGKTHKSAQVPPELGMQGWCVTTAIPEPLTVPAGAYHQPRGLEEAKNGFWCHLLGQEGQHQP